jgi:hypothetical protein
MTMKRPNVLALPLAALLTLTLLAACSAPLESAAATPAPAADAAYANESDAYDMAPAPMAPEPAAPADPAPAGDSGTDIAASADRKMIFSYNYALQTKDMTATLDALETAATGAGGYLISSERDTHGSEGAFRSALVVFRIPASLSGSFRFAVENAAHVTSMSEQGTDVTDEYFDVEARVNTLRVTEARLLALLEESGSLTELLELENKLGQIRLDLERLTGTLRTYDDLVALATFTVRVELVEEYTPPPERGFGYEVLTALSGSAEAALGVAQGFLLTLIYLLPYLILIAVVWLILRAALRNRKRRRDARKQETPPPDEPPRDNPPPPSA